ncbi:hypothetical protein HLB23_20935 [Nocardia uniformis]|uniref:Uncharacterized protein n=1 Tax=Nocardia uniformis TaxID=53432 RepID=A0A849C0J7_9NOCA|nr:hypothetical protein [Nocardia uniformis]NNH72293.1 hypothetical protein [Nocardia uniformis]
MTTLASTFTTRETTATAETTTETTTMLTRIFALFAAAGRAVPFHRESSWTLAGSSNVTDRDSQRINAEVLAITSMREHG